MESDWSGNLEAILILAALLAAIGPLLVALRRGASRRVAAVAGVAWGLAATGAVWVAHASRGVHVPEAEVSGRPHQVPGAEYVSSNACRACHPREYATWRASYHSRMTQVATPAAVLGEFDGRVVEALGRRYRLERRGEEFWVEMDDPEDARDAGSRRRIERRVALTTGSHHKQVYWYETGRSRILGQLPILYWMAEERWLPRDAAFLRPSSSHHPETGRWNTVCINCHATDGRPRPEPGRHFDSQVTEFGIACEACHGPAGEHAGAQRAPWRRYALHLAGAEDPSIVEPTRLDVRRASQVCGQCHAVQSKQAADIPSPPGTLRPYRPGDELGRTRVIARYGDLPEELPVLHEVAERSFWSDGVAFVAGREYNGLLESPCYEHGDEERGILACHSCHQLHREADDPRPLEQWADDQLIHGMEGRSAAENGNAACTQCHPRFAPEAQLVEHTGHRADSAGSGCYNCHMPYTSYGLLKAIRSHTVTSPSVANSLETGRPNACNLCHLDRSLGWAAAELESRHGQPAPPLDADARERSAALRWALEGDALQRALVAWSLGWQPAREVSGDDWSVPLLLALMDDPYEGVRFVAARSLRARPDHADLDFDFLAPRAERRERLRPVLAAWSRGERSTPRETWRRVGLDARGLADRATYQRLLARRDHRVVVIQE